jgi:hypothetical protein
MRYKQIENQAEKTYALIFDKGDEFPSGLEAFAREQELRGSHFTAVGAFRDVILGYFDPDEMDYRENTIDEQVEVVSLVGNVTIDEGEPSVHAHVVVAKSDATAYGGHVMRAHVWPTLEVVIEEEPEGLERHTDPDTGLALIHPSRTL